MAKKPQIENDLFAKTEKEKKGEQAQPRDIVKSRGVGLKESEWAIIDEIAEQTDGTYHNVAVKVLRDFVNKYKAGEIKLETAKTKKLEL